MSIADVRTVWNAETIILSYVIAVTGSFCTIQIMEQWRVQERKSHKLKLLVLASISLGGCGIWAMHFTGMQALQVYLPDGTQVKLDFELGLTILSLFFPIVGVLVGLETASRDPFFLELENSRRKEMVANRLNKLPITEMLNKSAVQRKIKIVALFSRPWRILIGGLWAALGVLGMHYLGMLAQRTRSTMTFDAGIVAASSVVAFIAATAAFWIIFRALTFWPTVDALRIGSALVMGVAVCGTHYIGMFAANHEPDPTADYSSEIIVDGQAAFRVASLGSLVLCFWIVSLVVVRDLRVGVSISSRTSAHGNTGNSSGAHHGGNSGKDEVVAIANGSVSRNAVRPTTPTGIPASRPNAKAIDQAYDVVPGRV